ncbi:MAG: hypothetical protein HYZ48_01560, partial [Chlamydiales bacterium]|nr:hypothetical protein [Chlamydiales bacterium]
DVISHLCFYQIAVVFPESNVSKDSLKKIVHACKQKDVDVRIVNDVLYADAMGSEKIDSYLEMVRHNVDVMIDAWENREERDE